MQESGCGGTTSLLTSSEFDHHSSSHFAFPGPLGLIGPALVTALYGLLQLESQVLSLSPTIIVHIASSPSYLVKLPPELLTRTLLMSV